LEGLWVTETTHGIKDVYTEAEVLGSINHPRISELGGDDKLLSKLKLTLTIIVTLEFPSKILRSRATNF
jgi:hypothetical protein